MASFLLVLSTHTTGVQGGTPHLLPEHSSLRACRKDKRTSLGCIPEPQAAVEGETGLSLAFTHAGFLWLHREVGLKTRQAEEKLKYRIYPPFQRVGEKRFWR